MMGRLFWLLLMWSLATPLWADRHALLIGIDDYRASGIASLQGAANDIRLLQTILADPRYGFDPADVRVLVNEQASHRRLQAAFGELQARVRPGDFVYIHYSGHGSYTTDLNGDEPGGQDQTWVSHGARRGDLAADDIDRFDVLDDELGSWLAPIYDKAGQVVMVSDSCHSATVSRGATALRTRAAPVDRKLHPLGAEAFRKPDFSKGTQIGSARDREQAAEYLAPDGDTYGLFTWFWAQALARAQPGASWDELFQETLAQVRLQAGTGQQPQLTGRADREVFSGRFKPSRPLVAVTAVADDGRSVQLQTGRLTGASIGSRYAPSRSGDNDRVRVVLTEVRPYSSTGQVEGGRIERGDLLEEISHSYPFEPLRLFVGADFASGADAGLRQRLRRLVGELPGYQLVEEQRQADLLLYLLRPDRGNGLGDFRERDATGVAQSMPRSYADKPPEVWVLTPGEQLFHPKLRYALAADEKAALAGLKTDLRRLLRVRELKRLASRAPPDVQVRAVRYRPDVSCQDDDDCLRLSDTASYRRLDPEFDALAEVARRDLQAGDLLVFSLDNPGRHDRYVYLINITADGEIEAVFPLPGEPAQMAELPAGKRDMRPDTALQLDGAGEETLKLIVSQQPIDLRLLESAGYSGGSRGAPAGDDPLSRLLYQAASNSRGRVSLSTGDWWTSQVSFQVAADPRRKTGARGADAASGFLSDSGKFVRVKVHFGSNREAAGDNSKGVRQFGNRRGELVLGRLWVSIPPNHRPGQLEAPNVLKLELDEDPQRHVVLTQLELLQRDDFVASLRQTLATTPGRSLMVYIHGFNNSFEAAARRTAQIAFDMNAEGFHLVPALFSWPSGDSVMPLQYTYAWTNKDWAKGDLAEFLLTLQQAENADRVFLVAHSMGTNLLSNAMERIQLRRCGLDDRPLFTEVILAAPDIDAGTFRKELAPALARLSARTTIYTASQDLALQVSQEMHGGFPRLGDSSEQVFVVEGLDTVDVSAINVSDIGHGYYAEIREVIRDISGIFNGHPVNARGLVSKELEASRRYWRFPAHGTP